MPRSRPLFLAVVLVAQLARGGDPIPPPERCKDELLSCREGCKLEFGTQANKRPNLGRCLTFCDDAGTVCEERYFEAYRKQEEEKKRAQAAKPDLSLPKAPLAAEATQATGAKVDSESGENRSAKGTEATSAPSTAPSAFVGQDVEKLGTTTPKGKPGKKPVSDLSEWDPRTP